MNLANCAIFPNLITKISPLFVHFNILTILEEVHQTFSYARFISLVNFIPVKPLSLMVYNTVV